MAADARRPVTQHHRDAPAGDVTPAPLLHAIAHFGEDAAARARQLAPADPIEVDDQMAGFLGNADHAVAAQSERAANQVRALHPAPPGSSGLRSQPEVPGRGLASPKRTAQITHRFLREATE